MKLRGTLVSLLFAGMAPTVGVCADEGFYLGIEGGQGRTELKLDDSYTANETYSDGSDTLVGAYIGYAFTKQFAFELAYSDLGTTTFTTIRRWLAIPDRSPMLEEARTTFESEAIAASLLGRYELVSGFSLTGRAGMAFHRYESTLRGWTNGQPGFCPTCSDRDGKEPAFLVGVGAEWSFHPHWAVRLQAQRRFINVRQEDIAEIRRGDVTMVTGGIEYRF